jgi:hypothetical protein
MPPMKRESAALAAEIIRCPVVDQCLASGGTELPCHRVVSWQGQAAGGLRYVPEPWSGHLDRAPILFVSSNPGGDVEGAPISDASYTSAWETEEIVSCCDDAFESWRKPGIFDGIYLSDKFGSRGAKPIRYWLWARARARELLRGRQPVPGLDYAMTEVVHCGTQHEAGMAEAFATCTDRYFERTLRAAPAVVVVCVGSWAKAGFKRAFNVDLPTHIWGPADVAGRRRIILSVPHPGAFGSPKRFEPYIGPDGLELLWNALDSAAIG